MDYRAFKNYMADNDPAYKHISDRSMRKKYAAYIRSNKSPEIDEADAESQEIVPLAGTNEDYPFTSDVIISDIDIPFGSLVKFMIKLSLASIPALIMLYVIYLVVLQLLMTWCS